MTSQAVEDLKRKRPEWIPWLTLVDTALRESTNGAWSSVVPTRTAPTPAVPALSGTTVILPEKLLRGMLERMATAAIRGGGPKMASLGEVLLGDVDVAGLFHASVTQDLERANEIASSRQVDPEGLQAVVTLLGLPFLQACRAQWEPHGAMPWAEGYCYVCGAWPALVETRGVERSRYHRCGRCGSEWYAQLLQCAYCRTTDHEELVALMPEREGARGSVVACRCCRGYLKVFTRLQGSAPSAVLLDDLSSVDLDLAAIDAGYRRPPGAGCRPALSVHMSTGRRFLAWNV